MILNRDRSWLGFNYRVLQEAANAANPLFERLNFLSIFSSNLNEFFRVRYPQVAALSSLKKKTQKQLDNFEEDIVEKLKAEIRQQLDQFGEILNEQIIPALKEEGIYFYYNEPIRKQHLPEIREIFLAKVLSYIQPIYLEGKNSEDFLPENNQLYFVITLTEDGSDILKHAIVNIPSNKTNRFFTLTPDEKYDYVIFVDDIVKANLVYLFPNQKIKSIYSIKVNRDAELNLEDEYSGNLLKKIEKQLKKREFGPPTRFLFENGMPKNLQMFLSSLFNISTDEVFGGGPYHNLDDLSSFPNFGKDLYFEKRKPLTVTNVMNSGDIFKNMQQNDILLHVPYQSYNSVLSFFNQAAVDVNVTDIYITLYRVANESHIINALISAARNQKNVVAFVELKARFDEANNIKWSRVMKKAGIKIIYSIPDIKVHSKIALIIKNNKETKQMYSVLSTGNFNEITANVYSDHVLMTTNKGICNELLQLFKFLELKNEVDNSKKLRFKNLLVSQFNMISELEKLIEKEIKKAEEGRDALIRIKVNNLEEPKFINHLYKASQAGVRIELLVRGINCIAAGVEGLSENIKVKRIVGRYLEHSRILIFGKNEDATVIMGSADLMTRNLYHRIEVYVKILNENCKKELTDFFDLQWHDNDRSVWLWSDYSQSPAYNGEEEVHNAQQSIYEYLSAKK